MALLVSFGASLTHLTILHESPFEAAGVCTRGGDGVVEGEEVVRHGCTGGLGSDGVLSAVFA